MSILIKGMEMPKSCWECHFGHGDTGICLVDFKSHGDWDEPNNCPLVPVPEPHGRLGDLNALYEKFARLESEAMSALKTTNTGSVNWIKWSAILTERTGYKFDIADAPTIIPADPAEED